MKTTLGLLSLAIAASASPTIFDTRDVSKSFAGSSVYFLQGLSEDDQKAYISTMADAGAKILRLWVSDQPGGNTCVKGSVSVSSCPELETEIGTYNDETLDLLDQTLTYLEGSGIQAIISLHDANKLNGANGNDIYGQTYGPGYFYEDADAAKAFDNRITHILDYTGTHSGKVWKEWDNVIVGFDIENEPFAPKPEECTYDSAASWICDRATTIRDLLGDSPIVSISGGMGGDITKGCTFMESAVNCDALDVIAVHRYAGAEGDNPNQWSSSYTDWISEANGKLVFLEEWGVNVDSYDPATEFPLNTADMNKAGLPWCYWQLLPAQTCDSSDMDQFGFFVDSDVPWQSEVADAAAADSQQDWTGVVY